jgi:hypothetical protein
MTDKTDFSQELIDMLRREAERIRDLERRAASALQERQDKAEYKRLLTRKAETLASLPDTAAPLLESLPEQTRDSIRRTLAGYAQRARMALETDSVFFMSMLLYPEDYREGQNNDLENTLLDIERMLERKG